MTVRTLLSAALGASFVAGSAFGGTETWEFDLASAGGDVVWTSPAPVEPSAFEFEASYEIAEVMATTPLLPGGGAGGQMLTSEVSDSYTPALLAGDGTEAGPAPVVLVDQFLAPAPAGTSLNSEPFEGVFRVEVDPAGFVTGSLSELEFGFVRRPFPGVDYEDLSVLDIEVSGTVTVTAVTAKPGDLDGDGVVGSSDLGIMLAAWGSSDAAADLDGDGAVGTGDLGILLAGWG